MTIHLLCMSVVLWTFALTSVCAQPITRLRTTIRGIERIPRVAPVHPVGGQCAPEGLAAGPRGLDRATNLLKNRIDTGRYQQTTIAALLKLPWKSIADPTTQMATRRANWTARELERTARYESRPVFVDGYIVAIHAEGKETTNCGFADPDWLDWHFWIVATEAEAHDPDVTRRKRNAVVGEITPRVRAAYSSVFNKAQLMKWARDGTKVRVSGWTMLDPDHPDDAVPDAKGRPASRGTIWEIHPVMNVAPARDDGPSGPAI